VAAANPPEPFPSSIDKLELLWFAVTRSGLPSPLKSPAATVRGCVPTTNGLLAAA